MFSKKLFIVLMLAIILLLPVKSAFSQVKIYGLTGAGAIAQSGEKPASVFFVGGNIPIVSNDSIGFHSYERTQFLYSDGFEGQEIEAISVYLLQQKTLGLWDMYAAIGQGFIREVRTDGDVTNVALKFEIGKTIAKAFAISMGTDYIIISKAPNQYYFYGMINMTP